MFWMEHKGLWRNPMIFWGVFIVFWLNNFLLFRNAYTDGEQGVSAQVYKRSFERLSALDENTLQDVIHAIDREKTSYDGLVNDQDIYKVLKQELAYVGEYDTYFFQKKKEFEQKEGVRIFGGMDEYTRKSALKTFDRLERFLGVKVKAGPSRGVRMVFESFFTDVLILFLLLLALSLSFMQDKESGQMDYVRTTFHGRDIYFLVKIYSLLLYMAEIVFLMYTGNLLCGWCIYGVGDLDRSLQSVSGYIGTGIGGSIWQALFLFYVYQCLSLSVIVVLAMFLMVMLRNSISVYTILAAVLACSGIGFYAVPENSPISVMKNINLIAFIHTGRIFAGYKNIRIVNIPVSYQDMVFILCAFVFVCGPWVLMLLFKRQKAADAFVQRKVVRPSRAGVVSGAVRGIHVPSFFMQECRKILIKDGILWLMLAFTIAVIIGYQPVNSIYGNEDDVFYKEYIDQIQGKCTEDKIIQVLKWKHENDLGINRMKKEMKKDGSGYGQQTVRNKYRNILKRRQAVYDLYAHAGYIKGIRGGFFYDRGYRELTGGDLGKDKDGKAALACTVALAILLSGVYSRDYVAGMYPLMESTCRGHRLRKKSRLVYGGAAVFFVFAMIYGSWYLSVLKSYGLPALDCPVVSMEHIAKEFQNFSVCEYLIFINAIRIAGFLIMAAVADFLSARLKSTVLVMVSLLGLFVMPLVIYLLGLDFMKWALLNPLFLGNVS